jgi:uncharacterized protein YaaW (UPF0174 family)
MDEMFVRADGELLDVLTQATQQDLALLIRCLRRARSCSLPEACSDLLAIADEFQGLGGNTIANKVRGHGVPYREIVADVGRNIGVTVDPGDHIADMEWSLVEHSLQHAFRKLDPGHKAMFEQQVRAIMERQPADGIWLALRNRETNRRARLVVFRFVLGHVLEGMELARGSELWTYFGGAVGGGAGSVGGPVGAIIGGAIGAVLANILGGILSLPGPAFRGTIPAVFVVGYVRARIASETDDCRTVELDSSFGGSIPTSASAVDDTGPLCQGTPLCGCPSSSDLDPATDEPSVVEPAMPTSSIVEPRELERQATVAEAKPTGDFTHQRVRDSGSSALRTALFFLNGDVELHSPSAHLRDILPAKPGIYGWYFDREILSELPDKEWAGKDEWRLLYVGITGKSLFNRIWKCHMSGSACVSAFRLSLGCLLSQRLGISPSRLGEKDLWFGRAGEQSLTTWLWKHARVAWCEDEDPHEVERAAFLKYGHLLPLNTKNNPKNDFASTLRERRATCRAAARLA